ncbi:hypothetical protein ACTXT7_006629 [Hymenolepis weldensis]
MNLATESGLKVAARISARDKPCIFETLLEKKYGPSIADFAFPKSAFLTKQSVLFDTILSQTMPSTINNCHTGGLDGECILINTDSSFSVINFVLYLEKVLSTRFPGVSHSAIIDKVLNRLHVINSRTATECILTLSNLRDIMKIDRSCLLIIDSASSLFGYIPIKEMTITRSVFLDYLKHIVETFSIQCLCFRMLTANQEAKQTSIPFYYHPTLRILFHPGDFQTRTIIADINDGARPTFSSHFRQFSRPQ